MNARLSLKRLPAIRVVIVAAIVTSSSLVTPAFAVSSATQNACRIDYKKLCPSYKLGSSDLRYCMESQAHSISERCIRAAVDNGDLPRSKARQLGYR